MLVSDLAQTHIGDLVKTQIKGKYCPNRFQDISVNSGGKEDLIVKIRFTKYDEGNRFARLMLAGLGSMNIEADVEIIDGKSGNCICKGQAGKTFAWGGVYGTATGIEDLEKDFAQEVGKGIGEMLGTAAQNISQGDEREVSPQKIVYLLIGSIIRNL